jgi:hypothetical protein
MTGARRGEREKRIALELGSAFTACRGALEPVGLSLDVEVTWTEWRRQRPHLSPNATLWPWLWAQILGLWPSWRRQRITVRLNTNGATEATAAPAHDHPTGP